MQSLVAPLIHQFFPRLAPPLLATALPRPMAGMIRAKITMSASPPRTAAAATPAEAAKRASCGRRTAPSLRRVFLRHYRICGEVKRAAVQIGVAPSTVYRWRAKDADFRRRWETLIERHRQAAEDRLMRQINEGERSAVFYRGRQAGWRVRHTARAAIAFMACLDRRERAGEKNRRLVLHSGGRPEAKNPSVSTACVEPPARKTGSGGRVFSRPVAGSVSVLQADATTVAGHSFVLHSGALEQAKNRGESSASAEPHARKTARATHDHSTCSPS